VLQPGPPTGLQHGLAGPRARLCPPCCPLRQTEKPKTKQNGYKRGGGVAGPELALPPASQPPHPWVPPQLPLPALVPLAPRHRPSTHPQPCTHPPRESPDIFQLCLAGHSRADPAPAASAAGRAPPAPSPRSGDGSVPGERPPRRLALRAAVPWKAARWGSIAWGGRGAPLPPQPSPRLSPRT